MVGVIVFVCTALVVAAVDLALVVDAAVVDGVVAVADPIAATARMPAHARTCTPTRLLAPGSASTWPAHRTVVLVASSGRRGQLLTCLPTHFPTYLLTYLHLRTYLLASLLTYFLSLLHAYCVWLMSYVLAFPLLTHLLT